MKLLQDPSVRFACLGALLSLAIPAGLWILLNGTNLEPEEQMALLYRYTGMFSLIVFSISGFCLGYWIKKTRGLSYHDPLTKLFNRQYLLDRLKELSDISQRYSQKTPFSLVMVGLDNLGEVTESYGQTVGDRTLAAVTEIILEECRETDIATKYNKDEFIILCHNTTSEAANILAKRIHASIEKLSEMTLGHPGKQTASLGIVSMRSDHRMPVNKLLKTLNQTLQQAKNKGGNTIVLKGLEK